MTEQFILHLVPERIRVLGYNKYYLDYLDLILSPGEKITIDAYNELYFIIDDPPGIIVESDYGIYDSTANPVNFNIHQHRGQLTVENPDAESRRIKFIRTVIVN